ncbi:MAG: flagellar protein FlgN [Clostridia bacterium]|nr:flagellar protein FlgN [Clostridia bacterium]
MKKVRAELSLLEEILMEQNRLVEELLRWGQEELEALTNDDFGRLLEITQKQQFCGEKLKALEQKRLASLEKLQNILGLEPKASLEELIKQQPDLPESFTKLAEILRKNFRELQELNELNSLLIKQSLAYVQKVMNALGGGQAVYQPDGSLEAKTTIKAVIDKSV